MIRIEDAAKIKQHMFHYFMGVAKRVGMGILDGKPVSLADRVRYWLGDILVYAPLKNVLGLSKVRISYTAGEAIGPDIFTFYRSMGLNLKQMYASTEASVFITIQPDGEVRPESSGTAAIDVEVRIEDDGEIMFRSPGVFQAYFKNDEDFAGILVDGLIYTLADLDEKLPDNVQDFLWGGEDALELARTYETKIIAGDIDSKGSLAIGEVELLAPVP